MSNTFLQISIPSPLGPLTLFAENDAIIILESGRAPDTNDEPSALLLEARDQLNAYFDGKLMVFDLPLAPDGPERRQEIWQAMNAIPSW